MHRQLVNRWTMFVRGAQLAAAPAMAAALASRDPFAEMLELCARASLEAGDGMASNDAIAPRLFGGV